MDDQERALSAIIGEKIKQRRRAIRLTQKDLGQHLGITFQQLQKIERGINRISAARLMLLAPLLQVGMDYFWEPLPDAVNLTEIEQELITLFRTLSASHQRHVLAAIPVIAAKNTF